MDSTIIEVMNKVHISFNTALKGYYEAYEKSYGDTPTNMDSPLDTDSKLTIEVVGKGVSLSDKGYTLQSSSNPMPIIDLNNDTLVLKVDLYVDLFDAEDGEEYFHSSYGNEVVSGVGLDDLLLNLSRMSPSELGEALFIPSDV